MVGVNAKDTDFIVGVIEPSSSTRVIVNEGRVLAENEEICEEGMSYGLPLWGEGGRRQADGLL